MRMPAVRLCLTIAGLLCLACGPTPPPPGPPPQSFTADGTARVLLIGVDGASWDEMLPLMQAGRLPHLMALAESGYAARLATMEPALSPVIWTTIATGKFPAKHGIQHFVSEDAATGEELPVTSNMRRTSALWNMLGDGGVKVGVVGWWVTWPAEQVNGWMVSPYSAPGQTTWKGSLYRDGREQQTWPRAYMKSLGPEIEAGVAKARASFARLFPVPPESDLPPYLSAYLKDTLWVHVSDTIFRDVGLTLLATHAPRFMTVYFGGVDVTGHRFWRFVHPGGGWRSSPSERRIFAPVLDNYYEWVDRAVGDLVAAAPAGTTVMVVSDHGMERARPKHKPPTAWNLYPQEISGGHAKGPPGIFILAGPGAGANKDTGWMQDQNRLPLLGGRSHPAVVDLTPTLLHLFGLPVGEDMDGTVLTQVLAGPLAQRPVKRVKSWDDPSRPVSLRPVRSPRLDEIRRRLQGLGYIGGSADH